MRGLSHWFKQIVMVVAVLVITAYPPVQEAQAQQIPQRLLPRNLTDPDQFTQSINTASRQIMPQRLDKPLYQTVTYCGLLPSFDNLNIGTQVVFSLYRYDDANDNNNWEIYICSLARQNPLPATRLTFSPGYDSTPKLNHGASRIVFVSKRDGNSEIYVMNVDGSGQTRLTLNDAADLWPTWSPDGTRLAFYSNRDGNYEIYTMNADGSNQTRLTSNATWDGYPTWSPDGSQLVFVSERNGTGDLWIMNANGTNQHQLTVGLTAAFPDWSPDGSRIIFNDDTNHDGWLEVAIVNADGTNLSHPIGSFALRDRAAPTWSPSGQDYIFSEIAWSYYQGNYYWTSAGLYRITGDQIFGVTNSGAEWWPDWGTTDAWSPSSQVNALPALLSTPQFTVRWSGVDSGSAGIESYDVQYRDGPGGAWTDWLTASAQTSADFTGQYGHTYYFRSRARDYFYNVESYPAGNGDTWTAVYQYAAAGQVLGNRDQPVTVASVTANPAALDAGISRHDGLFDLYFASGGTYTLTATRKAFGTLPPMSNVAVPASSTLPTFYLPPLDDQINDGHFESDTLSAWNLTGDLTPTITSTAHTGEHAVLLGGTIPSDTVSNGPYLSTIEQPITVPLTLTDGTLSLLYQVTAADPLSDTLTAYLVGPADTLTFTLPITATAWTHHWFDVSAWTAPTATLRIELSTPDKEREVGVLVDEITWGSFVIGSHPVYLPVMRR